MNKEIRIKLILNIVIGFIIGIIYGIPSANVWGFITSVMIFSVFGIIYGLIARSIELLTNNAKAFLKFFLRPLLKLLIVYSAIYIFLKYVVKDREAIYSVLQYKHFDPWSFDFYSVFIFLIFPAVYLVASIIFNIAIELRKRNQGKG